MNSILTEVKNRLGKPYKDFEFLLECLKDILTENGEEKIANEIPFINKYPFKSGVELTDKHIQLYSLVFQMVNMVEVNGAVQNRRKVENEIGMSNVNGLFANNLKELLDSGVDKDTILSNLPDICIEPVLTAHPTEAKRASVLDHHRDLYLQLISLENQMFSEKELMNIKHNIKLTLYRLWKTGEIYEEKPDVSSELRNVIHYLVNVFPEVIPVMDRRLIQAWTSCGLSKKDLLENHSFPKISFGNWVGGDRDGHPLITDKVTADTLNLLRLNSCVVIRRKLKVLLRNLSFTAHLDDCKSELSERILTMSQELGVIGVEALERNKGEAFRQFTNLIIDKLPVDTKRGHATKLSEHAGCYQFAHEILTDLRMLKQGLLDYGAKSIAYDDVNIAIRNVEVFGFHLASAMFMEDGFQRGRMLDRLIRTKIFTSSKHSQLSKLFLISSFGVSSIGPVIPAPALFITTSSLPSLLIMVFTVSEIEASSLTFKANIGNLLSLYFSGFLLVP